MSLIRLKKSAVLHHEIRESLLLQQHLLAVAHELKLPLSCHCSYWSSFYAIYFNFSSHQEFERLFSIVLIVKLVGKWKTEKSVKTCSVIPIRETEERRTKHEWTILSYTTINVKESFIPKIIAREMNVMIKVSLVFERKKKNRVNYFFCDVTSVSMHCIFFYKNQ